MSYLQLWYPLGSVCVAIFNLYQGALHWGWVLEACVLLLAAVLIHFVLNLGQVTKLSEL